MQHKLYHVFGLCEIPQLYNILIAKSVISHTQKKHDCVRKLNVLPVF